MRGLSQLLLHRLVSAFRPQSQRPIMVLIVGAKVMKCSGIALRSDAERN